MIKTADTVERIYLILDTYISGNNNNKASPAPYKGPIRPIAMQFTTPTRTKQDSVGGGKKLLLTFYYSRPINHIKFTFPQFHFI